MEEKRLICCKCQVPLEPRRTAFAYLNHNFYADLPRCPKCGQVYVSPELVEGKIASVETELEEK